MPSNDNNNNNNDNQFLLLEESLLLEVPSSSDDGNNNNNNSRTNPPPPPPPPPPTSAIISLIQIIKDFFLILYENKKETIDSTTTYINTKYIWLFIFCSTGVGLGLSYEYLSLQSKDGHSPPSDPKTFFLCFVGYWSQTIIGGLSVLYQFSMYKYQKKRNKYEIRQNRQQQQEQQYNLLSSLYMMNDNNTVDNYNNDIMTDTYSHNSIDSILLRVIEENNDDNDDDGNNDIIENNKSSNNDNYNNPFRGNWTKPVINTLLLSAIFDGIAQALDYIGQVNGGYILFTIFHSSVTLFSCIIAVCVFSSTTDVTTSQWVGITMIVLGIFVTAIPSPIVITGNFTIGLVCSCAGSLCLAASYPCSELVFRLSTATNYNYTNDDNGIIVDADDENVDNNYEEENDDEVEIDFNENENNNDAPPDGVVLAVSEEMSCFIGSLLNTLLFTIWTLVYTIPRWEDSIASYVKSQGNNHVIKAYLLYGLMVGFHTLSFWKSVYSLGTIPCAVSKGAQQAGIFVISSIVYCKVDTNECIIPPSSSISDDDENDDNSSSELLVFWLKIQKSVAFLLCCIGVIIYTLHPPPPKDRQPPEQEVQQQRRYNDNDYQLLSIPQQ